MSAAGVPVSGRRRIAALAALVGAATLVAMTIGVLLSDGVWMLLALVGLCVAVAGSWWLVTERMPRRLVGAVGAGLGVGLVVVAFVLAIDSAAKAAVRIVAFLVALGVTAVAARLAMLREIRRLDLHVRAGGAPTRPVLICNPRSGGGKVGEFGLIDLAAELGVETVVLEPGLDLERLARDAVDRGADCLGMAGGDGSQALVASVAVAHDLPFVCVSAGTRNHFALDLGLRRDDPRESMYAFRDAYERRVDYATVNGRLFVNNVSLGVYAQIVQEESYRDAKVDTTRNVLPEMLGRRSEPFDLQFTTPDGTEVDGAILVMVSNNPYVLGISPDNAQRRHLDTGRLGVFAVNTRTGGEAAGLVAAQALGQRHRSRFWHEFTATEFEVRSRSGSAFAGVDGEALDLPTPLRFEIRHRGLTLLVPEGNLEVAEQRRARDVRLSDLLAVAAGHEPRRLT